MPAIGDEILRLASTAGLKGELSYPKGRHCRAVDCGSDDGRWSGSDRGAAASVSVAGKLEYKIQLHSGNESAWVNEERPTVISVSRRSALWVLVPHVVCMFLGLLLAARAGLDAALGQEDRKLVIACVTFLTVGGMILGPIVQKAAFGEYWTGWPFGPDLTDNKTVVAWIGWIVAAIAKKPRYAVIAALATFVVFAIPHSVLSGNVAAAVQK